MKQKLIFLLVFLSCFLVKLEAQEIDYRSNLIGLRAGVGISPALNFNYDPYINADGMLTDYGVYSSPSYFFHSELTYARQIFPRFFIQTGLVYGYEAYNVELRAGPDYIQTDESVFPASFTESDMEYRGIILRGLYQHPLSDKTGLFGSAGITLTLYYRAHSHSLFKSTVDGEEEFIFYMKPPVGEAFMSKRRRFVKYDFELGLYHKITNSFDLRASVSYSFSQADGIQNSWFRFDGSRHRMLGEVSRKISQPGFNIGLTYSFPWEKKSKKSPSTFFNESIDYLFGERTLDFRKNSIGFTQEFVQNAQMRIHNQFVLDVNFNESDNGMFPIRNKIESFISINYLRHLNRHSGIGIEYFIGKYRMRHRVVLDEELDAATFLWRVLDYGNSIKPSAEGLILFYRHDFDLSERSSFFVSAGGGIMRTPKNVGGGTNGGTPTFGATQHLWRKRVDANFGKDIRPVIMMNAGYRYRFSDRISLNTSMFFRYSDLVTHEVTSNYSIRNIFTNEQTLMHEGEYSLKFRHYGLQIGLQYNFGRLF